MGDQMVGVPIAKRFAVAGFFILGERNVALGKIFFQSRTLRVIVWAFARLSRALDHEAES